MSDSRDDTAKQLRRRLKGLGLSDRAINAAWPGWWSDAADDSPSARAELRFSVARRLGLDPTSLFGDVEELRFLWREEARFKHLLDEDDVELAGITSFGRAVAAALLSSTPEPPLHVPGIPALALRKELLTDAPYVGLLDLIGLSWGVGIPVVHLRVFPWPQKRMAAMTARVGDRFAMLLAKDSMYPAPIAFYVAHELGHIALGHISAERLIIDLDEADVPNEARDEEEAAADTFALELLTGEARPTVLPEDPRRVTATELARVAVQSAGELQIEPGVLAQCFGYSTGLWPVVNAALGRIYGPTTPVWQIVNQIARRQLGFDDLPADTAEFLGAVLEEPAP